MAGQNSFTNAEVLALLFVIAPQFKTTDPDTLAGYNALIDALRCEINASVLGCCSLLAMVYLLAHMLTIQTNPYVGISNSISEGQLSLSLGTNINGNAFASTPYGQQFWYLIGKYKVGAYVTGSRRTWYGPACGCGY